MDGHFLSPHINFAQVGDIDTGLLVTTLISSIAVALPLGNYIHQITDSAFNPYARNRFIFLPRKSIQYIESKLEKQAENLQDRTYQALLIGS